MELDRRRHFTERLDRVELGLLVHYAMSAPERLQQHERDILASAAKQVDNVTALDQARELLRAIDAGGVLIDAPTRTD